MKKKVFIIILLLSFGRVGFAQYNLNQNKVWALPPYYGLDFRNGPPVPVTTSFLIPMNSMYESCASLAGQNGLIFYTSGTTVWDKNNQVMPHGSSINGPGNHSESSSQGTVIVPVIDDDIDNPRHYYVFTVNSYEYNCKFFCNMVKMPLNNGLGDIDTTFYLHHVVLDSMLSEKIIVMPGCDNNVWIMVHQSTGSFKAYEVSANGINLTPVLSGSDTSANYILGQMTANPQQNKIVVCKATQGYGALIVYDFDAATGMVNNPLVLDSMDTYGYYSAVFSPDGSKVYAKAFSQIAPIFQYDLNASYPAGSAQLVGHGGDFLTGMQLGPDGKIYLGSNLGTPFTGYRLGRINYPDSLGTACDFHDSIASLNMLVIGNFPNTITFPATNIATVPGSASDSLVCPFPYSGVTLYAAPSLSTYIWNDGSVGSSKTVMQEGTYWVKYKSASCTYTTDTFHIKGNMPPAEISFNNNILSTTHTYSFYHWYKNGISLPNSNTQYYTATGNGLYSVKVNGTYGCADSAAYQLGNTGIIGSNADIKGLIRIYPNPADDKVSVQSPVPVNLSLFNTEGKKLIPAIKTGALDVHDMADGLYFLRIGDPNNRFIKTEKLIIRHKE